MRAFFNGWRRKAGCLILAMASILTVIWFRGMKAPEQISIHGSGIVRSSNGLLIWSRLSSQDSTKGLRRDVSMAYGNTRTGWQWGQFHFGQLIHKSHMLRSNTSFTDRYEVWQIPHWSIVILLSLLSAYLILWKPRTNPAGISNCATTHH